MEGRPLSGLSRGITAGPERRPKRPPLHGERGLTPPDLRCRPAPTMRILVLAPRLPWPAIDGGRIAMSRLAESLARAGAEVEILSLNPRNHRAPAAEAPALPLQAVGIDTSRRLVPALSALAHRTPYIVERFVSRDFREALRLALRRFEPDFVQIESPFLLPYAGTIRAESRSRIVLRSLNVEFRIWESLALRETSPLRRLALRRVASSLRRYEVRHLDTPDVLVAISATDGEDFRRLGCTRPIHVAPCGVTLSDLPDDASEPGRVGFIGSLDFRPNQEAVEWIVDELWPRVVRLTSEASLSIAGSSPPDWLRRRARGQNIEFLGYVDDAGAFLRRMSVVIAPLFAGGGMRIKVLDAMAFSKPVVATPLGAGGIEIDEGLNLVIADNAASFAEAVVRLLRQPEIAARIGREARATVAARYDSDTIARELLGFYKSL
jgi:glycosyltransferase involved in cell wall biosynthesis